MIYFTNYILPIGGWGEDSQCIRTLASATISVYAWALSSNWLPESNIIYWGTSQKRIYLCIYLFCDNYNVHSIFIHIYFETDSVHSNSKFLCSCTVSVSMHHTWHINICQALKNCYHIHCDCLEWNSNVKLVSWKVKKSMKTSWSLPDVREVLPGQYEKQENWWKTVFQVKCHENCSGRIQPSDTDLFKYRCA